MFRSLPRAVSLRRARIALIAVKAFFCIRGPAIPSEACSTAIVHTMPLPLLLIVDDEVGVRESLKMILGKDFRVVEADSAEAALAKLEDARPEVVLLDLVMPKSDGLVVLERLKEIHPECPVIMLTGMNSKQLAAKALSCGAFDFVGKPFDVVDLRKKIARALEHSAAKMPRA
jgi:DNA-binding NtrC family response regulator